MDATKLQHKLNSGQDEVTSIVSVEVDDRGTIRINDRAFSAIDLKGIELRHEFDRNGEPSSPDTVVVYVNSKDRASANVFTNVSVRHELVGRVASDSVQAKKIRENASRFDVPVLEF